MTRLMRMPRISASPIINELPLYNKNDETIAKAVVTRVVLKIPSFLIHLIIIYKLQNLSIQAAHLSVFGAAYSISVKLSAAKSMQFT